VNPVPTTKRLAARLHFPLKKYNPSDDPEWDALTEYQRDIFPAVIRGLMDSPDAPRLELCAKVGDGMKG
jgi:hypothetical protein